MKWIVKFPKARFWVVPGDLVDYAQWRFEVSSEPAREALRHMVFPSIARGRCSEIASYLERAARLGCRPGWVRYPTDSTRIQVFDPSRKAVCKLVKSGHSSRFTRVSLHHRRSIQGLPAPSIYQMASDGTGFVEEWIAPVNKMSGDEAIRKIIDRLIESLYRINWISPAQYVEKVSSLGDLDDDLRTILSKVVRTVPTERWPVSRVHGDLTLENMGVTQAGKFVAVDWEYTRECLVTYDLWLYCYRQGSEGALRGETYHAWRREFLAAFSSQVQERFHAQTAFSAVVAHLVHLVERISFLKGLGTRSTEGLRRRMQSHLEDEMAFRNGDG